MLVLALAVGLTLTAGIASYAEKTVTIKVWAVGDPLSTTRVTNIEEAGNRLNKYLAATGADVNVQVEKTYTREWGPYRKRVLFTFKGGDPDKIPDIVITGCADAAMYAEAGYIIPLDEYIAQYPEVCDDVFPSLLEANKYKGQIWGFPQDISVRMFYFRKDLLKKAGWTDEQMDSVLSKTIKGEFTLDDLAKMGQDMLAAGVVQKGKAIWTRPTPGDDWLALIFSYGGEIWDPAAAKFIFDKSAILDSLKYMKKLVDMGLTPKAMADISWPEVHAQWVGGNVGIFMTGGSWHWPYWGGDPHNLPVEEVLGFAPLPAGFKGGEPNTVGGPMTHTITAASRNKDLAFLLVMLASSLDLNTKHAVKVGQLAIRRSQISYGPYAEAKFQATLSRAGFLDYLKTSPTHEKTGSYIQVFFKGGIVPVMMGILTPEEALDSLLKQLKGELGDELMVRE